MEANDPTAAGDAQTGDAQKRQQGMFDWLAAGRQNRHPERRGYVELTPAPRTASASFLLTH